MLLARISLTLPRSSLPLQQCLACLIRQIWICVPDINSTTLSILDSDHIICVQCVSVLIGFIFCFFGQNESQRMYKPVNVGLRYRIVRNTKVSLHTNTSRKVKSKLATIVEGDPKAPYSIATTLRCRGGRYSILPGLLHFTLEPYLIMLSVKQGGIKFHF